MKALLLSLLLLFSGCTLLTQVFNSKKIPKTIALLIVNEKYPEKRELDTIKGGIENFQNILYEIGVDEILPIKYNITHASLIKAFNELENKIEDKKNTNIFIYFSGHGVMDKDSSKSYVEMIDKNRTLINLNIFFDFVKKIDVRATVLAFDACRDEDNSSANRIEGIMKKQPDKLYISYPIRNTEKTAGTIPEQETTYFLKFLTKHITRKITAKEVFELVGEDLKKLPRPYISKRESTFNGVEFLFYKNLQDGILTPN